jgi:hypothetical protein
MALEPKTYISYDTDNDLRSGVVLDTDDTRVKLTENRGGSWSMPFWIPREELAATPSTIVGKLPKEKFDKVRLAHKV